MHKMCTIFTFFFYYNTDLLINIASSYRWCEPLLNGSDVLRQSAGHNFSSFVQN